MNECMHPTCRREASMCGVACAGHWHGIPTNGDVNLKAEVLRLWSAMQRRELDPVEGLTAISTIMHQFIVPWWTANAVRFAEKCDRARAAA